MEHKNDLKIKIDKEPRKKENILKRIFNKIRQFFHV